MLSSNLISNADWTKMRESGEEKKYGNAKFSNITSWKIEFNVSTTVIWGWKQG